MSGNAKEDLTGDTSEKTGEARPGGALRLSKHEASSTTAPNYQQPNSTIWVKRPTTILNEALPSLTILAALLLGNPIVRPHSAGGALAELLVAVLVAEDLLHVQGRDGPEDVLRVHQLLLLQELAQRRRVHPRRRLELVLRVLVFRVRRDLWQRDRLAWRVVLRRFGAGFGRRFGHEVGIGSPGRLENALPILC